MENGVKDAEIVEVNDAKSAENKVTPFIGGEVHIIADGNTGAVSIQAPEKIIIALGILEAGKAILIDSMNKQAARASEAMLSRPAIIPATGAQLTDLASRLKS